MLTASNKAVGDQYGHSVALTDRYALVGALYADPNNTQNAGSAYVYAHSGGQWLQQAILTASNKSAGDGFGYSVTIDRNHACIGSRWADPGSVSDAGAAYIFVLSGNTWVEEAVLTASNKASGDNFSTSVSLEGDFLVIGARFADSGSIVDSGAAYIFTHSGSNWNEHAILTASNKLAGDKFGWSSSLSSQRCIIGAYDADPGSVSNAGTAYIFARNESFWNQEAIVTASVKSSNLRFGISVSINEQYALVGTYVTKSYVFSRRGSSWVETQVLGLKAGELGVSLTIDYAIIRQSIFRLHEGNWTLHNTLSRQPGNYGAVSITNSFALIGNEISLPDGILQTGAAYIFVNSGKR
eukprot:TRINITY_DN6417_c0_g1_i1.p1 TRINITY_DN6417_c0_g1~~TRINITY_DN6417_c0_g1_i1.p1  ORF type:complete len:354 (-),score=39.47 TRINITY_DN6417_c0_g1_i1:63-1124(-)